MDEEGLRETTKEQIYVGQPIKFNEDEFFDKLIYLHDIAEKENEDEVRYAIKDLVPTYVIKEEGEDKIAITG